MSRMRQSNSAPTRQRWRLGGVATRLVGAVVVPLVLLGLITGQLAVDRNDDARSAIAIEQHIAEIATMTELYSAIFDERLMAGVESRGAVLGRSEDAVELFFGEGDNSVESLRARTDAALAVFAVSVVPIDRAELIRLRQALDGQARSTAVLVSRFDEILDPLLLTIEAHVFEAQRQAVRLRSVELSDSVQVLLDSIQVFSASTDVIADLVSYWFAVPVDVNFARGNLARADERYRTAGRLLTAHTSGVVAEQWAELGSRPASLESYVVDALEGAATPFITEGMVQPLAALSEGVSRSRKIGMLSIDSSAQVREMATTLADDLRSEAENAALLAFVSIVASLVAAMWFGRSIVSPVRRVTEHAHQVGSGDLDIEPLPIKGPPEFKDASVAINELVANLQLMERKAQALAACAFDSPVLSEPLPGRLGDSLHESMRVLSGSIEAGERLQSKLSHQATHDALTGIPNRASAIEHLERAIARTETDGSLLAVAFVDLDDFKEINDTHGHAIGDVVLRTVAQRMLATVRAGDLIARLGGDEFLIVTENLPSPDSAVSMAQRLVEVIGAPVSVDGFDLVVGACVGVALAQPDEAPTTVLHHADLAVYRAKSRGSNHVDVYDKELEGRMRTKVDVEDGLREALKADDQLYLDYQPLVESKTGRLRSVEALIRWNRVGHGRVQPDDFIGIAEASNLIIDIDKWVLKRALAQFRGWDLTFGVAPFDLAVNVSGRHVVDPNFVRNVEEAVVSSGIDPGRLILEVAETVLVADIDRAAAHLQAVRDLGVRIAVDDFGTGFTSLAHLLSLPIDEIKVDRSFVSGLPESSDDLRLVQIVIDLARHLSVPIVAEGVETEGQRLMLEDLGCDVLQGYLFSRPLSPERLTEWAVARSEQIRDAAAS